jgi:citrate synthase
LSDNKKSVKVLSRNESFVTKARTKIWQEIPDTDHEYLTTAACCFGYSQEALLDKGYGITDMLFLLTQGELPGTSQRKLLDALGVALSNPGPRHPATRAAMEAAVSKTRPTHLLPISLMVLGGEHAAGGVESAMRFLRLNKKREPAQLLASTLETYEGPEGDVEFLPGFGPHYEARETLYGNLGRVIKQKFEDVKLPFLDWSLKMDELLQETSCALRSPGLAAAVLLDLGFHPRYGVALHQYLSAPGLIAHGIEMSNQPVTSMPFVADENYHQDDDSL